MRVWVILVVAVVVVIAVLGGIAYNFIKGMKLSLPVPYDSSVLNDEDRVDANLALIKANSFLYRFGISLNGSEMGMKLVKAYEVKEDVDLIVLVYSYHNISDPFGGDLYIGVSHPIRNPPDPASWRKITVRKGNELVRTSLLGSWPYIYVENATEEIDGYKWSSLNLLAIYFEDTLVNEYSGEFRFYDFIQVLGLKQLYQP